jgi:hypothetical protein
MGVTGESLAGRTEHFHQIDRLVSSELLHGSESLCKLLRYLAEQALSHPGATVKEYQIATEVFGRPDDFDPRLDSTVRVQTGRLRSKLAEYYAGAGDQDSVIVGIPKGSYTLTFHVRPVATAASPAAGHEGGMPHPVESEARPDTVKTGSRALLIAVLALSVALASTITALSYLIVTRQPIVPPATSGSSEAAAFRRLWRGFVDQPDQPWVVFSNAEFVGRPETGMRYYDPGSDPKDQILDHYTGVGEVLGVHELDHVFTVLNHGLRVKRGRLLSLDDAKHNDLIFVGSPSENLTLREIPNTQDFVFRRVDTSSRKGDLAIVNVRPRVDEAKIYYNSPLIPATEDYALVALVPGMNASRWVMLLAGITTIGTQAAVEYVCRTRSIDELLQRLNRSVSSDVGTFEAVLRVKISRGVPVESQLVAIHAR